MESMWRAHSAIQTKKYQHIGLSLNDGWVAQGCCTDSTVVAKIKADQGGRAQHVIAPKRGKCSQSHKDGALHPRQS